MRILTYQNVRALSQEQPTFFDAPEDLYLPYEKKLAEVYLQIAKDNQIPTGDTDEELDLRIEAFRVLPPHIRLSKEASALLQEARALRSKIISASQAHTS